MNERLKELKEQSRDFYLDDEDYKRPLSELHRLVEEKFAELIIKECAEICMMEMDTGLMMAPQAPWIAKQIREHFGISE